jgi:serine/threonine protein kinase
MAVDSLATFVDSLMTNRLLQPDQLNKVTSELMTRIRDARALARELVQRGWLTVYQVNQIFQGHARDLVLGHYRILDMLGEGGVSKVYRAFHTNKRIPVALKVVRKELLSNTEAIRQFQQETKTIATLSHPNIVQTVEADAIGGTHFFAMEYIEGIDLGKLVRLSGPLPIIVSCDFIRQAALGLQHAHERCLVHRDIKPANLFLITPTGTDPTVDPLKSLQVGAQIKILDWGLADIRVPAAAGKQEAANTLMREETIGTADYLAPEQAVDATKVDIRADIYSLGCAFYYLLTSQPPFPGGSLLQKLLKHREAPPPSINEKRPEAPPGLAAVLQKMVAKKPEDRYRTPASVAAALSGFVKNASSRSTMNIPKLDTAGPAPTSEEPKKPQTEAPDVFKKYY